MSDGTRRQALAMAGINVALIAAGVVVRVSRYAAMCGFPRAVNLSFAWQSAILPLVALALLVPPVRLMRHRVTRIAACVVNGIFVVAPVLFCSTAWNFRPNDECFDGVTLLADRRGVTEGVMGFAVVLAGAALLGLLWLEWTVRLAREVAREWQRPR